MKCAKCGAELKIGCIYCSVCGQEAQIVPDYNLLEDDFLKELLKEKREHKEIRKVEKRDDTPIKKKKSKWPVIAIAVGVAIVLIIMIILLISYSRNGSFEYQIKKARVHMQNEEYGKAQKYLERSVELNEYSIDAWFMLADVYIEQGETEDAIDALKVVLKQDKNNAEAYKKLIELYAERKEYDLIAKLGKDVKNSNIMELFSNYIVTAPVVDMEPGEYDKLISLEISSQQGTITYYTLDGSDPKNGMEYKEPIPLEEGKTTVRMISINELGICSEETEGAYRILFKKPDKPNVSPNGGSFNQAQQITVKVPDGCIAYYTWDGSDPTANSERYTAPLEMPEGNNILSVILINEHNMCSDVLKCNFIYIP